MANQVTGRVWIRVDGKTLRSKDGAKLKFGGLKREAQTGNDVHGFTESMEAPEVECTLSHMADTSLQELKNITDATLQFETDTGKTLIVRHAWCTGELELTGGKGELSVKFNGLTCEEN